MGFSPPIQAIRPKPAAPPIPRNLCPANPATLRHSRAGGNPDPKRGRKIYRKRLKPNGLDSRLRGNDGGRGFGIPAFAGMTESGGNNERRE
ncbi:hypothetical protein ELQ23_12730 [Neisseria meningitidis]|nr:hypothetical protein [Neisseria meningitidis]